MKTILRSFALFLGLVALASCGGKKEVEPAGGAIPFRLAISPSSGQGALPYVIAKFHLDTKYGFAVEQVDFAAPGQQYMLARTDAADVFPGNFAEVQRQRKAGIGIKSFRAFESYSNQIVVPAGSDIRSFADIKGRRFGQFGTTMVDWLILRAAGKRAYGFDIEKDATAIGGAPPLLNQMLSRGSIDAAIQFRSVALSPVATGQLRVVGDIPQLIKQAGFDPNAYYLLWNVTDKWLERHPDPNAIRKLDAMFAEAYRILATNDQVWEEIGKQVGVKPELIPAFRDGTRKAENPPYRPELIAATQRLLDAIVATTGPAAVGVTRVDPDAFLFPAEPEGSSK
ncbi:ABC transporter substrate-binding protein [Sphingomonas sp. SRS2]|uniref:ABC transporter substrate-binding protein n=1 Tax=Sphingomonas sp. SRS2 TaxID=133190 RepID=UPI000618452E|nr:ABC transporter substrate-binding protein [Sphingomonas sp. SRS2]KKC25862.1 hypothetical protein WP12_11775 [Sphingomonas sp. SRS2]